MTRLTTCDQCSYIAIDARDMWQHVDLNHSKKGSTMQGILIHTTAPMAVLAALVDERGTIQVGSTPRGEPDCFYGWSEPQDRPECRIHHVVHGVTEEATAVAIATALVLLKHQVTVTALDTDGNDVEAQGMPSLYDWDHSH